MTEQTPPPYDPWQQPASTPPGVPVPPPSGAWGQPPGPAWTPPLVRRTNPWAIVALVTGIIALFPVAIAAGIVALVQIRKRDEDGTPLAIIGLVAGGFWTLVLGIGVVAGLVAGFAFGGFGFESGSQGRVANAGSTTVGVCLDEPPANQRRAPVVDCRYSHQAEVYQVETLGSGAWPGNDEVDHRADLLCDAGFKPYVGEDYFDSDYEYGYYIPDELEWDKGERRVVCVILPGFGGDLRGTVRDGGEAPAA